MTRRKFLTALFALAAIKAIPVRDKESEQAKLIGNSMMGFQAALIEQNIYYRQLNHLVQFDTTYICGTSKQSS
jgi:hypothetical protein